MFALWPITALLLIPLFADGQSNTAPAIHFDVVSIKQNRTGEPRGGVEIPSEGNRLVVTNSPMYRIIGFAFDRQRNDLIEGVPDWARSERWDIEAKVADENRTAFHALTFVQKKAMLQSILEERCKMNAHMAKKEVPVYAVVVAKTGLKMHRSSTPGPEGPSPVWNITQGHGQIHGRAVPIDALLYALSGASLERQVVDHTGLTGVYDFDLVWTPEDAIDAQSTSNSTGGSEPPPPSIFTAIQEQLGLRLEATKAQVDAVIVDHLERPSPN